jgi:hypothetical protein
MKKEEAHSLAGRKLFIGLPAYDFKVSLKLAISLAKLAQHAPRHGVDIQIGSICGCSVVSRARNLLVNDFLESDCDTLLFIDSDINFEADDVFRLMAWTAESGRDIVAGVPRTRSADKVYIADLDEDAGSLTMDARGLVKAQRVATAFMMIRREVITSYVEQNPARQYFDGRLKKTVPCIFDFLLTEEGYIGEDYLFCDQAQDRGFYIWVDPAIKLGHMGVQEYEGDFGADVLYPMIVPPVEEAA